MLRFIDMFLPESNTRILDVGGTLYNWKIIKCQAQITLLNLDVPKNMPLRQDNMCYVQGDGRSLAYRDKEFDICFSNSVIEHLGTFTDQKRFAKEISRAGKSLWVQTPAKNYFIEPHFIDPFVHYLPKKFQRKMIRNCTICGLITRPNSRYIDKMISELRLLSYNEMQELFPDCEIIKEKFLGMTKAYIALRK